MRATTVIRTRNLSLAVGKLSIFHRYYIIFKNRVSSRLDSLLSYSVRPEFVNIAEDSRNLPVDKGIPTLRENARGFPITQKVVFTHGKRLVLGDYKKLIESAEND